MDEAEIDRETKEYLENWKYPIRSNNGNVKKSREEKLATIKAWRKANPDKERLCDRNWYLKHSYKISHEIFVKMVEYRKGRCDICGVYHGEKLCVDHDKVTGMIAGLLCKRCNTGIGMLYEDPIVLQKAIEYVRRKLRNEPAKFLAESSVAE